MLFKKTLTEEEALKKLKHYCSYQERCHIEVNDKLYSLGLYKKQVDQIISILIEDNYLNEERFAVQFAGGKFRMKQWGRRKIQFELQKKRVSSYCIKMALKEILEEDYMNSLKKLAAAKWKTLDGEQRFSRMAKTQAFLMQRGFEPSLIQQQIQQLTSKS